MTTTTPYFPHDHEMRRQLRETRATLLSTLAERPDDLVALAMVDVLAPLDPDRDADLAAHRTRFHATRADDWRVAARSRGVDRILFHLAHGLTQRGIGREVAPALERAAVAISEARPAGVTAGMIDAAMIPPALAADPRVELAYYRSGHLRRAAMTLDRMHEGELALAATPGAGTFTITKKVGGYGTATREAYRDGSIHTVLNTPWHDGTEWSYEAPWTKWVMASLDDLASLLDTPRREPRTRRSKR